MVSVFFPMNSKVVRRKASDVPGRPSASAEVMWITFALSGQFRLHLCFIRFTNTEGIKNRDYGRTDTKV